MAKKTKKPVKRIRHRGVSEDDAEKRLFKTLKKMGLYEGKI